MLKRKNTNGSPNYKGLDQAAELLSNKVSSAEKINCIRLLDSCDTGLIKAKARSRSFEYGLNEVSHEKASVRYIQLLLSFINPFFGLFVVLAITSLVTDVGIQAPADPDYSIVLIISIMVMLSVLLRFVQKYRSNLAAEKLKSMGITAATHVREGQGKQEIDIQQWAPGDLILHAAGDIIAADVCIFHSKDLFVSLAMLTGGFAPVEKLPAAIPSAAHIPVLELNNSCFMVPMSQAAV